MRITKVAAFMTDDGEIHKSELVAIEHLAGAIEHLAAASHKRRSGCGGGTLTDAFVSGRGLREWVKTARPGDRAVYRLGRSNFPGQDQNQGIQKTMAEARAIEQSGEVALFQKDLEHGVYEYVAIRISPRAHKYLNSFSERS